MKMHVPRYADDRYAAQRQAGFAALRFEPELEAEYRGTYIPLNAGRLRVAHTLGILSVLAFIVLDLATQALMPALAITVLVVVSIPALAVPIVATWMHNPDESVQRYVYYGTVVLGISLIVVVELGRAASPWFPYEAVLLVIMYVYLISGLLFWQASTVGWIIVAAFVLFELALAVPRPTLSYEVFYLVIGNLIGMIGVYILQYESRRAFLLHNELWMRAVLDPLTGVLNRREFRNQLDTAWAVAQRQKVSLGLLLVDVDNFKCINDSHGHPAGDQVLRAVGEVLKGATLRPLDAAGRYGGDEFIALWFDVTPGWIETMAAGLPQRLAAHPLTGAAAGVKLTVSGGAVRAEPRTGLVPQDAINLADLKLYEQKRSARGTIATATLAPAGGPG